MKKILVAYATKTGSTAEVAVEIGKTLAGLGREVDVKPIAEAGELSAYSSFVIGAPINGFRWRQDALDFVSANRAALSAKPTAFFLLSIMYGHGRPSARRKAETFLAPVGALVKPVSTGFFGGVMASAPPWPLRVMFGVKKDAPRDARDWNAIRTWAAELAEKL